MREIEFRGKRVDNGEWVYGYYFVTPLTSEVNDSKPNDGWFLLTGKERHCISQNKCVFEVDPSTVGQYTGLKDKNRIKIYQGDICKFNQGRYEYIAEVKFEKARFILVWDIIVGGYGQKSTHSEHLIFVDNIKVIGNIHDNPKLLGVK